MRLVIQRVTKAKVSVGKRIISEIGPGLFILVGIHAEDVTEKADALAEKLVKLRVMADETGKMNKSVKDLNASILIVSQFTLYADTSGGNRPSFIKAARPEVARPIYERLIEKLKSNGLKIATGIFGEYMDIHADLDGPVTIIIEA